jgi:predicted HTH transcriptional regulator
MGKELYHVIEKLIKKEREDDWWGFKQQHHSDKAELVHNIICMANNRANRDSYIIFGIADNTFDIIDVQEDSNRRNQQGIIDILRNIKFAGSVRPRIELRTLIIEQKEIDVLIIRNAKINE